MRHDVDERAADVPAVEPDSSEQLPTSGADGPVCVVDRRDSRQLDVGGELGGEVGVADVAELLVQPVGDTSEAAVAV